MYVIGQVNRLKVLRETDIGYMLDGKSEEIFLHKNESNFLKLKEGEIVDAFLYFDNKERLAATLKSPLITIDNPSVLEVVDVLNNLGVFLNMGINKDLLLSKDNLPLDRKLWPIKGDKLYVELNVKNRLTAKLLKPQNIFMNNELELNIEKTFFVQYIGIEGMNLFNEDHDLVFVHNSMFRGSYRLGESVNARILNVTENGYSASLIKQKENLRFDDAEIILNALKQFQTIPLTAKSSSEEISKYFEMSRKAFKRALGLLYKEDKVKFEDDKTILINGDKNE